MNTKKGWTWGKCLDEHWHTLARAMGETNEYWMTWGLFVFHCQTWRACMTRDIIHVIHLFVEKLGLHNRHPFSTVMGGPNLEIFKFSLYLFVPLAALIHFGNPEWYRTKVVPVGITADSMFMCSFFPFLQYREKLLADRGSLVFSLAFKASYIFLIIWPVVT